MPIKHPFVSAKPDGGNADLLQPSYWNAAHAMDAASPAGLAGATSAARFVGGTTTGAPVAGTFAVGDYVVAQDGKIHICTVAGSPGTWTAVSGGADLVQVASGAGSVRIPGLSGSPDRVPASPSAYDDEFDATLSGWTTLGALDIADSNAIPSHLHLTKTLTVAMNGDGIYKACPSMPFTVTAKLTDYLHNANYSNVGLMVGEATPGKFMLFGPCFHSSYNWWTAFSYAVWNSRTSRASWVPSDGPRQPYVRMIVASSTSVTMQVSGDGLIWVTKHTAINPGFTIGSAGFYITGNEGAFTVELAADWIRFT